MSGFSCRTRGLGPGGILPTQGRTGGFTLVEVIVLLFIMAILAAFAVAGYRQGLFREYAQSAQIRAMVNALHLAQWRALKGGTAIPIIQGTSVTLSDAWYHEVEITTAFAHSFKVGDWVSFSDIASLPPGAIGHSGLNVGRYCVLSVGGGLSPTTFRVSYLSQVPPAVSDIPQSPPYPSPAPVPMVRNATGAAKLVIVKSSQIRSMLSSGGPTLEAQAQGITSDPQNFVYDDSSMFVWGYTGSGYASPEVVNLPENPTYALTVRFNSRGLPADPAGYQLAVGNNPSEFGAGHPRKIITITPTGKINPGAS